VQSGGLTKVSTRRPGFGEMMKAEYVVKHAAPPLPRETGDEQQQN
jgi:hypothetical protein